MTTDQVIHKNNLSTGDIITNIAAIRICGVALFPKHIYSLVFYFKYYFTLCVNSAIQLIYALFILIYVPICTLETKRKNGTVKCLNPIKLYISVISRL